MLEKVKIEVVLVRSGNGDMLAKVNTPVIEGNAEMKADDIVHVTVQGLTACIESYLLMNQYDPVTLATKYLKEAKIMRMLAELRDSVSPDEQQDRLMKEFDKKISAGKPLFGEDTDVEIGKDVELPDEVKQQIDKLIESLEGNDKDKGGD